MIAAVLLFCGAVIALMFISYIVDAAIDTLKDIP